MIVSATGTNAAAQQATVTLNPGGNIYSGASINVTITVTSPATKLRWNINSGAFTTVNATSTVVNVPLSQSGRFLGADALDGVGTVLASTSQFYQKDSGGGQ